MAIRQYIGSRYVPIFGRKNESSINWDNTGTYEPLTIVLHNGNSYTSRQFVPAGIDISNTDYWALTGNYNAHVDQYRIEVETYDNRIETVENKFPVQTADIADGAITADKIASSAVGSGKIADGAITADKIASSAVGSGKIADGAITADKIASSAVGSTSIADGAITTSKIASGAVESSQIADGAITADKIATGASAEYVKLEGTISSFQSDGMGSKTYSSADLAAAGISNIDDWFVISVQYQRVLLNNAVANVWMVNDSMHEASGTIVPNCQVVKNGSLAATSPNTLQISLYNDGAASRQYKIVLAKTPF